MRCLLVDDNEAFVEIARRVLDPDGVKVTGTASNIAEAVLRVGELRPDIVLIDVMLGDENGFDLARRLADPRVSPAEAYAPFLAASSPPPELSAAVEDYPTIPDLTVLDVPASREASAIPRPLFLPSLLSHLRSLLRFLMLTTHHH